MTASQPAFFATLFETDGMNPDAMVKIDDETGCYIGSGGFSREGEYAFLYHDRQYHFFVNAVREWVDDNTYDVVLVSDTVRRFEGPPSKIFAPDLRCIRKNLESFFEQRDFANSKKVRPKTEVLRKLKVKWRPQLA